jgi:4-carboxymuconolactone decarboxylase
MTDTKKFRALPAALTYDDVRAVSPALEHYMKGPLLDGLWKRPELSPRDRSIVTVAALTARMQTIEMPFHFSLALDNGVKALPVVKDVFEKRPNQHPNMMEEHP